MAVLDRINNVNDIKQLSISEVYMLAGEIRQFLVQHISETGGHLASNLGAVELTLALHMICDLPKDKIVWDVGHQSYTHKILTGRKEKFDTLRQFGGMSGFPKRSESDCDCFNTGHSSTSVSAGLGLAEARDILGEDYKVISVIGDGAFTGGMAYEALNNASHLKSNFIVVLNDNKMSISENVGGFATHMASMRTAETYQEFKSGVHSALNKMPYGERTTRRIQRTKNSLKQLLVPGMIFENMGVTYLGPIDGHNIEDMVGLLREAVKVSGPVVVHVITEKGKGYLPAAQHPDRFHGTAPFDIETGELKKPKEKANYTDVVSSVLKKIGEKDEKVVAITAAMADGTGLKRFRSAFPERFFDVGIAEGHAVTFAAGLASAGLKPVVAVYSSFLQRAYDQIIHDVCIQNLPVVFCVDRAGLVGADGETHQGIFDLSYLSMIPNMTVCAPKNKYELYDMLYFAYQYHGPIAIRYPRGSAYEGFKNMRPPIEYGKSELMFEGEKIALVAVGSMVQTAVQVREKLLDKGINATVVNARFVCPLDTECLDRLSRDHQWIVTMEENVLKGGFGEACGDYLLAKHEDVRLIHVGVPDVYVEHGGVDQLKKTLHMDADSIVERICSAMSDADD